MEYNQNRLKWLDVAKGITIILVVIGHLIQSYFTEMTIPFKIIYSFHMSAFFIFSGYLFNEKHNFKIFARKKFKSLMIPYICFVLITFLYKLALSLLEGNLGGLFSEIKESAAATILMQNNSYFINLWFLPCLFTAMIFLYAIFKAVKNEYIRFLLCFASACTILILKSRFAFNLPLCADTAAVSIFWLYLGHLLKITDMAERIKKQNVPFLIAFAVLFGFFNYLGFYFYKSTADSFRSLNFSNPFISLSTGIFGALLIISISIAAENIKVLNLVGKRSNEIYGLHFLFLGIMSKILSYLPVNIPAQIAKLLLSASVIILIILVLTEIYEKLKNKLTKKSDNKISKGCKL